jgi:T5SS/PEP-CTERM-associated repeat protein/autotransporter-associated beta strand protein
VRNSSGIIGSASTASNNSVLVTGAGSTWTNTKEVRVGGSGTGTLTVSDGGSVAATSVLIGQNADSAGTLNIGRFGTNDSAGTISAPTIAFGNSTNARAINFNQSNATTISAVISGNGSVNQLGSGTTTLSASNTYTGATTVSGGGLLVSGSIASSAVTVQSGGILGGSGTVGAVIVQSGGTINPGSSPGTLNINGDIDWLGGGNYNWQIAAVTGTAGTVSTWDLVSATGILDLTALTAGSKFNINLWSLVSTGPDVSGTVPGFDNTQNYTWKIATAAGGITGFNSSYFNLNTGANNGTGGFANGLNGGSFSLAQSGNDLNLVFTAAGGPGPSPVPEPGTWAAAALLVGGAAFMRWRRRAKVA